jgi:uncharacterized membrane protein
MKQMKNYFLPPLIVITLFWVFFFPGSIALADDHKKQDLPQRAISLSPEYTGVVVEEGDNVSIDLKVKNGGRQDENIELSIPAIPNGWDARIKTFNFGVNSVMVDSDSSKTLTFKAKPDKNVSPGDYTFVLKGQTRDGKLKSSASVLIQVVKKDNDKLETSKGITISTSYPVLQGPTGGKFEFSLEVKNDTDKDGIFNLNYVCPKDWEINFKPAYQDKYISSLRIMANRTETLAVEVKPYVLAEAGKYPLKVKVSSDTGQAESELEVNLTGTYKIEVGTLNGLLSLNAFQGKPANISFYVKNTGSATQNNISFISFKPENWKVEFKPEKLDKIAPGEFEQIEMTIVPANQALVGDYSVTASVKGEKISKDLEFRVTVKASTAWGWIGMGIIVLVVLGLVAMFIKFGRR